MTNYSVGMHTEISMDMDTMAVLYLGYIRMKFLASLSSVEDS